MGERCTQARFLGGKPNTVRSTSNSVLCDRCIQEGYTSEDAPTSHSEPVPNEQVEDGRERHWEQLDGEEFAFSWSANEPPQPEVAFSELLRAARVLFANNVSEEERIIPTLAFANRASALPELKALRDQFAKIEDNGALREQFSADFYQRFRGLMPIAVLDKVLILSRVPMFLNAVTYSGATVVKEVVIDVFKRSVKPEEVAERYERWLVEKNLAYEESNQGTFSWTFSDAYLAMMVAPGNELNEGQVAQFSSSGRQLIFPPPQLVADLYESLKGSVYGKKSRGLAYALEGRQSGVPPSPYSLIPTCVAWYLRELGRISNKHKLAKLINQHLLAPCGKRDIGVTSDNAIWTNIDKVANSIMRVERALQDGLKSHPTRVSETHT